MCIRDRVQAARAQARMQALGSHELEVSGAQQRRKVEDVPGMDSYLSLIHI